MKGKTKNLIRTFLTSKNQRLSFYYSTPPSEPLALTFFKQASSLQGPTKQPLDGFCLLLLLKGLSCCLVPCQHCQVLVDYIQREKTASIFAVTAIQMAKLQQPLTGRSLKKGKIVNLIAVYRTPEKSCYFCLEQLETK